MTWTPVSPGTKNWVMNTIPLITQSVLNIVTETGVGVLVSVAPAGSGWTAAPSNSETWTPN